MSTNLTDGTREVEPVGRDVVVVPRRGEVLRRDTLLDPLHDSRDDVVLCVVREWRIGVQCRTKGVCAYSAL